MAEEGTGTLPVTLSTISEGPESGSLCCDEPWGVTYRPMPGHLLRGGAATPSRAAWGHSGGGQGTERSEGRTEARALAVFPVGMA